MNGMVTATALGQFTMLMVGKEDRKFLKAEN
jgi:hypothetical protein